MSHKCFISYKHEDTMYKDLLKICLDNAEVQYSVIEERINSHNDEYVMKYIRDHGLSTSTVTLFLIGTHSSECEGKDDNGNDINYYIQRELQASLFDGEGNRQSGILGIVLPSMEDSIFGGSHNCADCGCTHRTVHINDRTVIREFSRNYFMETHEKPCCWGEDERYCVLVRWSDFVDDPTSWIEKAFSKKSAPVADNVVIRGLRD